MRSRIAPAVVGVLLAGVLSSPAVVGDAHAASKSKCVRRVCLTVGVHEPGRGVRITSVDIRKPRKHKVRAWGKWGYRRPGGRWHIAKGEPVTNHRGIAAYYTSADVRVPHGTRVCGWLGKAKVCRKI